MARLRHPYGRLQPLAVDRCRYRYHRLAIAGSARRLMLSRVHWVRPEMVVEVSYVEWTPDGLLRHVVYLGEREDKPASDVTRSRLT
jgi:ATP-dependent DNA ligase